jgi:hypothetical protein
MRRQSGSAAAKAADAKASPPPLPSPDRITDKPAELALFIDGPARRIQVNAPTPGSLSKLMAAFGTKDPDFLYGILGQICSINTGDGVLHAQQTIGFLLSTIQNSNPRNELETMQLAQMACVHYAAMDMAARLNHREEYHLLAKLAKTFGELNDAFQRGRKDPEQPAVVQNMTVRDGGQAVVGNITQEIKEPAQTKAPVSPRLLTEGHEIPMLRVKSRDESAQAELPPSAIEPFAQRRKRRAD